MCLSARCAQVKFRARATWSASLAPGGGHGIAGSANFSTVELFAKTVPR